MHYSGAVYRPPSEARSLIVQCTLGCSHNKCAFCTMYKDKKFSINPIEQVLSDLDEARAYGRYIEKIFLADGDALILPMDYLLTVLDYIHEHFPTCKRVAAYATTKAIMRKTDEELRTLREHGLEVKNTSKAALAAHRSHPLVAAVSRYRSAAKLLSSYLLPIPKMLRPDTGRLHPQYAQIAAWTGRMSCYAPNIQQIPRDEAFRSCFAAPEGRRLLIADYPQIELRVAAQITRDRRMLEAYRRGLDLHGLTASLILGTPPEAISPQERQYAKAGNFGLIYAMGADGLRLSARQSYGVEMTREQAERFRRLFFEAYPAVRRWHAMLDSRRQPQGRTLAGRKYAFPAWYGLPAHSNAPVQGTAADILKKALGTLALSLSGSDAFPVAAIHDEVIVECPKERVGYYGAILKNAMEQAAAAILPDVPTAVEVRAARRWSEK